MKTLLVPGHSGLIFGHYLTKGKRSPQIGPDIGSYEGEFNRAITQRLLHLIPNCEVLTGPCNLPQVERRKNINWLADLEPNLRVLAIHANAASNSGWQTKASGARVFIRKEPWAAARKADYIISKQIAESIDRSLKGNMPYPVRPIREANFTVLKVKCPAVLVECGFQDHRFDASYMASENGRDEIALAIARGYADAI